MVIVSGSLDLEGLWSTSIGIKKNLSSKNVAPENKCVIVFNYYGWNCGELFYVEYKGKYMSV